MNSADIEESDGVWRVSSGGRSAGVFTLVVWCLVALGVTLGGGDAFTATVLWLGGVGGAVMIWRWAFVPYVALRPTEVVVQNRWRRVAVPYADIAVVEPGYYGVVIRRRTGSPVIAWAVQKPNLRQWTGSTNTRADLLAEEIRARSHTT